MKSLFWNTQQQRVRALWRLLIFLVIAAAIANPLAIALDATGNPLLENTFLNPIVALAFLVALWVCARYIDRRPIKDFGLGMSKAWWIDFGVGFAIGAVIMSTIFGLALFMGWVEIRDVMYTEIAAASFAVALAGQLARYAAGSFFEELMTRSYLLRIIAEGITQGKVSRKQALLVGWVFTSILFGVLHLANPGATPLSALNITLLGMLFGLGMVYTGRLALPIGLHMAWNVFQNNVFGLPNSGKPANTAFLVTETETSNLWTGGAFGLEGGFLCFVAIALGWGLVWLWLKKRDGKPILQLSLAEAPA